MIVFTRLISRYLERWVLAGCLCACIHARTDECRGAEEKTHQETIHPANLPYVKERMAALAQMQQLIQDKKQRLNKDIPALKKELNERVLTLLGNQKIKDDPAMEALSKEVNARMQEAKEIDERLASFSAMDFTSSAQMIEYDNLQLKSTTTKAAAEQALRSRQQRLLEMVAEDAGGKEFAQQWRKLEAEEAALRAEIGVIQPRRDVFKRMVANEINAIRNPGQEINDLPVIMLNVAPRADAAVRQEAFERRNEEKEIAALGKIFFDQMDLALPGMERIAALVKKADYVVALEEYKRYFFRDLSLGKHMAAESIDEEVDAEEADDDGESNGGRGDNAAVKTVSLGAIRPPAEEEVTAAMQDLAVEIMDINGKKTKVIANMGRPGAIHWTFADATPEAGPTQTKVNMISFCQRQMLAGHLGSALLASYVLSGNKDHLSKWSAITDDWAINWSRDYEASPNLIRNYNILIACEMNNLIRLLKNCARLRPEFIQDLPATVLARLLLAANREYLSPSIRMGRSGIYNFRIMMINNLIPNSLKLQEFKVHQWALREACRLMELNWVHKIRRDGANAELANAGHENTDGSLMHPYQALLAENPKWLSPFWSQEFQNNVAINARYWLHGLKQDGCNYRLSNTPLANYLPQKIIRVDLLDNDEESLRRMWKVFRYGAPKTEPQIRSESMGFAGYYYLREGWNPDDRFLYFHCINQPVCSGRNDNNGFLLAGSGLKIMSPPVVVDNRTQYSQEGLVPYPGGKTNFTVAAKENLVKSTRFHTSPSFDLAEGIYDGAYRLHYPSPQGKFYDIFGSYGYDDFSASLAKKAEREGTMLEDKPIKDVHHSRFVISLHGRNFYIITDFVESQSQHEFKQHFTIETPVPLDFWQKRVDVLKKENIDPVRLIADSQGLQVRNFGFAQVDMRFFSGVKLGLSLNDQFPVALEKSGNNLQALLKFLRVRKLPKDAPIPFSRIVTAKWSGEGTQALVCAIAPGERSTNYLPTTSPLTSLHSVSTEQGVTGFEGTLADGTPICFKTARKSIILNAGEVNAAAKMLLVVGDRGLVLDCTRIVINGSARSMPAADFEFSVKNADETIPIFRPIAPVTIDPQTNVFADKQIIEMKTKSSDVDIRYTVDGSAPSSTSPLYQNPIEISQTAFVRAKAFRKGVAADPWAEDYTHASVMTWAVYERKPLASALPEAGETVSGLTYEFFNGPWATIMAESPTYPSRKRGIVKNVFDLPVANAGKPFGMRYSGLLKIPEDGVYTFHAPAEFVSPDKESGYDLRVMVDGEEWYPQTRWHAHGTWSVALAKGMHAFKVIFTDLRFKPHRVDMMWGFPNPAFTWQGATPELKLSGPGLPAQPIPASMLYTVRP